MSPRLVMVTGAADGIGAATARAFAVGGDRLVLVDRDGERLGAAVESLDAVEAVEVVADVTDEVAVAGVLERAAGLGGVDVLVNVVGGSRPGRTVVELAREEWDEVVALNLTSTFLMCRAAMVQLTERRGVIVNVSSGAGLRGMRANPAYVAAKAGVAALTRALAIDHGPAGVRVNAVAPGPVRTPLMERNRTPEEISAMGGLALVGRVAEPAEVAGVIWWLASPVAGYVMGQTIEVDGGPAPPI